MKTALVIATVLSLSPAVVFASPSGNGSSVSGSAANNWNQTNVGVGVTSAQESNNYNINSQQSLQGQDSHDSLNNGYYGSNTANGGNSYSGGGSGTGYGGASAASTGDVTNTAGSGISTATGGYSSSTSGASSATSGDASSISSGGSGGDGGRAAIGDLSVKSIIRNPIQFPTLQQAQQSVYNFGNGISCPGATVYANGFASNQDSYGSTYGAVVGVSAPLGSGTSRSCAKLGKNQERISDLQVQIMEAQLRSIQLDNLSKQTR